MSESVNERKKEKKVAREGGRKKERKQQENKKPPQSYEYRDVCHFLIFDPATEQSL